MSQGEQRGEQVSTIGVNRTSSTSPKYQNIYHVKSEREMEKGEGGRTLLSVGDHLERSASEVVGTMLGTQMVAHVDEIVARHLHVLRTQLRANNI